MSARTARRQEPFGKGPLGKLLGAYGHQLGDPGKGAEAGLNARGENFKSRTTAFAQKGASNKSSL